MKGVIDGHVRGCSAEKCSALTVFNGETMPCGYEKDDHYGDHHFTPGVCNCIVGVLKANLPLSGRTMEDISRDLLKAKDKAYKEEQKRINERYRRRHRIEGRGAPQEVQ